MKKLSVIVFILALSMLISVSGYSKAVIKNKAELSIVPPSQALIAISVQKPFKITIHNPGTDDCFVTPPQGLATLKITNNSRNDLKINHIKCTTEGIAAQASADYEVFVPAGRTMPAQINIADSSVLTSFKSLTFEFDAEWDGGKTVIQFAVPVDKNVAETQQESITSQAEAPADPVLE